MATAGRLGNTGELHRGQAHHGRRRGLGRVPRRPRLEFDGLAPGDPADPETDLAPLSSERAAQGLAEQLQDALDKGATGARRRRPPTSRDGAFGSARSSPTSRRRCGPTPRSSSGRSPWSTESSDEDEAVELANSSAYGLGGSVFGEPDRARAVADRLESGMVFINALTSPQALPFGGLKRSGFGRELSERGITRSRTASWSARCLPTTEAGGVTLPAGRADHHAASPSSGRDPRVTAAVNCRHVRPSSPREAAPAVLGAHAGPHPHAEPVGLRQQHGQRLAARRRARGRRRPARSRPRPRAPRRRPRRARRRSRSSRPPCRRRSARGGGVPSAAAGSPALHHRHRVLVARRG